MLQVLPQNIANLIAAGEVVSRPASVVKELVENAVDAGARNVSVSVVDSGRTLIQVADDGGGMTRDEALLCFERHATSKIAAVEDLENIVSYGFRGEALASIAAVAQVTLQTRRQEDEVGTKVEVEDSKIVSSEEVSCSAGTRFSVRNLFYNVPARRKFLKSDAAEMRNVVQEFLRVALTRPSLAFKLSSNGKEVYNLRSCGNVKQRILDIYGMNMTRDLVEISVDTSVVKVRGYVGNPKDALKRQGNQFLFVNGRFFRSAFFNKAVCKPYEKLIPQETSPAYFIYLETAPDNIDVNIHPAKTEIKFQDEPIVFDILSACVREALGKNDFTPSIDFDMQGAPEIPVFNSGGSSSRDYSYSVRQPEIDFDPLFNPFNDTGFERSSMEGGSIFEESETVSPSDCGVIMIGRKYIAAAARTGLMLINIRRARQRIFYEKYMECVGERQPVRQQTLFPVTLELSGEDKMTLLEQPELTENMGFDIRDFGSSSVVVYGLPDGFSPDEADVRHHIDDLIAALRDDSPICDYRQAIAAKMAESAASAGLCQFSQAEAQLLVDTLLSCREPSMTPDGHKCMTIIKTEELDKLI